MAYLSPAGAVRALPRLTSAQALVLRMAFGATFAFVVATALHWEFTFLGPLLTTVMLASMPARPTLIQGLVIPIVILVATTTALAASALFGHTPPVLLALVGLVLCLSFYLERRGLPVIVSMLVQVSFCGVPLLSTVSFDVADSFSGFLLRGSLAAAGTVWIAHALFPVPPASAAAARPAPPPRLTPNEAAWVAISDTLVLIPLLARFMIGGDISNIVMLIVTLNLVRELDPTSMRSVAVRLFFGNLLGGALAVAAQQYVVLADSFVQFLMVVFLASLGFASGVARGGGLAPIYRQAFMTFLLILGLGIVPITGGSEDSYVIRIIKVTAAGAYAIGILSLLARLRRRTRPGSGSA